MNYSRTLTAQEILDEANIGGVNPHRVGRQYTTCPNCSHLRHGFNRKSKCLAVNIDDKGVRWFCNHDEWTGGKLFSGTAVDGRGMGGSISSRAMPQKPAVNGYASLHRTARHNWR